MPLPKDSPEGKTPAPNQKQAALAQKRAEALRANLKKRKDQTSARHKEEETVKE